MTTLFYVDDSKDDLFYVDYMSKKQQLDVDLFCFSTAEMALEVLETRAAEGKTSPDLLVADLYMPLDSGIGLITRLRLDDRFKAMRLAICSGSDAAEDRARSLDAGADVYLEKPLDLAKIILNLEM
ncbi:response regulator [Rhizobium sp. 1AS11]|uniref:response regulator n=1 Tax=Rhizobium acaciae TaxID=2989736 RepID=UPI00027D7269|nr:response regulator [Rhizobium acaciae]EJC69437.1 response regulator with CheY-like receiver domain and winged-helix DNA-binding domain [Rhizobium leguminosarum bv. viciae WSM1455]MCW1412010.1 response regulator [Rhizobium acaciae]MCW1744348.1 response regulator [Rhizobium acaciae]MCW1751771.1 response regulator [Rhizobium acaciae]